MRFFATEVYELQRFYTDMGDPSIPVLYFATSQGVTHWLPSQHWRQYHRNLSSGHPQHPPITSQQMDVVHGKSDCGGPRSVRCARTCLIGSCVTVFVIPTSPFYVHQRRSWFGRLILIVCCDLGVRLGV